MSTIEGFHARIHGRRYIEILFFPEMRKFMLRDYVDGELAQEEAFIGNDLCMISEIAGAMPNTAMAISAAIRANNCLLAKPGVL